MLTIALPKGRIAEQTLEKFEKAFGETKLDVYQKMATGLLAVASRVWSFAGSHKQV